MIYNMTCVCLCVCVWERLENVNIIGHEKGTLVHSRSCLEPSIYCKKQSGITLYQTLSLCLCLMKKCECLKSLCVTLCTLKVPNYVFILIPAASHISEQHIVCKEG